MEFSFGVWQAILCVLAPKAAAAIPAEVSTITVRRKESENITSIVARKFKSLFDWLFVPLVVLRFSVLFVLAGALARHEHPDFVSAASDLLASILIQHSSRQVSREDRLEKVLVSVASMSMFLVYLAVSYSSHAACACGGCVLLLVFTGGIAAAAMTLAFILGTNQLSKRLGDATLRSGLCEQCRLPGVIRPAGVEYKLDGAVHRLLANLQTDETTHHIHETINTRSRARQLQIQNDPALPIGAFILDDRMPRKVQSQRHVTDSSYDDPSSSSSTSFTSSPRDSSSGFSGDHAAVAPRMNYEPAAADLDTQLRIAYRDLRKLQRIRREDGQANCELLEALEGELTTALNGALGILVLLAEASDLPASAQQYAHSVEKSLESLLPTISGTAKLARMRAQDHASVVPFDARKLMEDAIAVTYSSFVHELDKGSTKWRNRVHFDLAHTFKGVPQRLCGDPEAVRTCLKEFLSNALRISRNGAVWVEFKRSPWMVVARDELNDEDLCHSDENIRVVSTWTEQLELQAIDGTTNAQTPVHVSPDCRSRNAEKQWLCLTVHDDGPGIDLTTVEKLFVPFGTNISNTIIQSHGGGGIGLALAAGCAKTLGGKIIVESSDQGSSFSMIFPAFREDSNAFAISVGWQSFPDLYNTDLHGLRVCVIEDKPRTSDMIGDALKLAGCAVTASSTWVDGVAALRQAAMLDRPYDIVVLSGESAQGPFETDDVVRLVRGDAAAAAVKLILVCSKETHASLSDVVTGMIDCTITPPVRISSFLSAVKRLSKNASEDGRQGSEGSDWASSGSVGSSDVEDAKQAESLRVLVAEDNKMYSKMVSIIIESAGHSCDVVKNGKEAVRMAEATSYDLIMMDLQMPIMDGAAATRLIRAYELQEQLLPVPIVALTATASATIKEECLRAGFDNFLGKPVKRGTLLELLSQLRKPTRSRGRKRKISLFSHRRSSSGSRSPDFQALDSNHDGSNFKARATTLMTISEEASNEFSSTGQEAIIEAEPVVPSAAFGALGTGKADACVLIIGDNIVVRHLLCEIFARFGIESRGLAHGQEGRAIVDAKRLTLIVMDVSRKRTGDLQRLFGQTEAAGHGHPPVVVLTWSSDQEEMWLKAGCVSVVAQPLDYLQIVRLVLERPWVDHRRESDSSSVEISHKL